MPRSLARLEPLVVVVSAEYWLAGSGAELCLHLVAPRTVLQVADVALAVYEHVQLGGGVAGGEFRLVQHPLFVRNGQRSNR